FCRELGADAVINYREEDFVARVHEICVHDDRGTGADVILDIIGAKYLERNIKALAADGRLVIIGMQGGTKTEINLGWLMQPRKPVRGTTVRARAKEQQIACSADVGQHVWPGVISGDSRPIIHVTLPLADAAGAHRALEEGENIGKVLLVVAEVGENA